MWSESILDKHRSSADWLKGMVDADHRAMPSSRSSHQRMTMTLRSPVNVNKVATLRNSRGGREPNVIEARRGVPRGRRAGHHRAPARRSASHHARRCPWRSRAR